MLKHRKRISMFTLAIFMLTLVFSGMVPALAATKTAPGSPPTADVQSSSSSRDNDRPNGVSPEGDAVKNSIGQGPKLNALLTPYLAGLKVYNGAQELALSPGFSSWTEDYEVQVNSKCQSISLVIDPQVNLDFRGYQEKTNWVKVESGSWNSTYQVHDNPGIIINTNSTVGSGTPGPIPLNAPGQDTEITITAKNVDESTEAGSSNQTKEYKVTVHRSIAPWLESMRVMGPAVPYYVNNSDTPIAIDHEVAVPESCDLIRLELDPRDLLRGSLLNPKEWTTKVVVNSDLPSSTTFMNNSDLSNFVVDVFLSLKAAGEDTLVTMTLYSNKGETIDYNLRVHRYLNAKSVALQLDQATVPMADGAELLMSEKVHDLKAIITPTNANFPTPMLYEWVVSGETEAVDTETYGISGSQIKINPNSDHPGTVDVTVNIRDMAENIYATASCTIHVGKIDIWLEKEDPDFNADGSYEASFGYNSTFPVGVNISIPKTGTFSDVELACLRDTNSLDGSGEIIDGERPAVFEPGPHPNEFRVKYWDGDQTWRVIFEGSQDKAVAKTFQSISLNNCWEIMGLDDQFQLIADPSFCRYGNRPKTNEIDFQEEIVWEVLCETTEGVVSLDAEPNELTCNVKAQKPGKALVMVSIADNCSSEAVPAQGGKYNRRHALCFVTVLDNRTLTLDQAELTVRRGRTADLNALIDYKELCSKANTLNHFGLPEDWNEVQWGFLAEDEHGTYIADSSEYGTLTASGTDMTVGQFKGLQKGQTSVVAYLGNIYNKKEIGRLNVPREFANEVETLCAERKLYLNRLPEDRFDTCVVTIKNPNRPVEPEPAKKTTTPPVVTPPPAALETLDVTITVGNNLALVNDQQVTLAGNTLLIGKDRAMVDYADMAKLIPGLQVAWDWQALTVTFTKDGKEVKMVLDQVPAGFDVPFMNIGGRLVVPVRYVGSFFGATVDWINNTLVVHMYK